uniref:non-specific serine/threonine protein kinase n=1 Tax=Candidatus Kentrum sp. FW TaxID=2126338 RepID=A0A450U152_9GAMM|nr:MAG: GTPase SAR1 family protein [Candidatus Kentron sp. FW]
MTDKTTNTPFDFEKFHKKVKARLTELGNPQLSVAFAARMAMAALPMLADRAEDKGFLWYWQEKDREKHLLAVCRALQICWSLPIDFTIISRIDAAHAAAADAAAAHAAADAAAAAAAADAAYAYAAADDAAAAAAADAAAHADNNLIPWIERELASLSRTRDIGGYLTGGFPPLPLQAVFLSHLRQLPSFDYWADWFEDRYAGRPLDPEILKKSVQLPAEIRAQDPRAINRYLKELTSGKREAKIKRVRAIFIGNGEAGKTSLIQALDGKEVVGDTAMTCGIAISEWKVPGTDLRAHFWDFGGQVIAHATHQFFLRERCVYVLVLNARGTDSNPNQQAEYWLEFVRAFGNDAPVLLVGNKCDLTPVSLDTHRLRERYANIRDFHGLSATEYREGYARQFEIFRDAFIAELTRAGEEARLYFSREEFAVIEDLRERSRKTAFLEQRDFEGVCQGHDIGEGERRQDFLNLLDQLGEVIHFPALSRAGFREFLLNPRWLTHGVYRLLYSETLKDAQGVLRWNDVRAILRGTSIEDELGNVLDYPEEKLDFLVRAMTEFKLCYPAPDRKDTWIVPDLLPSDQPARIDFDRRGALSFDFRFETFLPRHVLGMFMVEHYRDIQDNRAWQHGVHLESQRWKDTQALIRADYQARVLSLAVAGSHVERYFSVLYDSIYKILERMPKLGFTKRLHLDDAARIGEGRASPNKEPPTEDFENLLALEAKGDREFTCKFGTYDLQKLLKPLPREPEPSVIREKTTEPTASRWNWKDTLFAILGILGILLTLFPEEILTNLINTLGSPVNISVTISGPGSKLIGGVMAIASAVMLVRALWRRRRRRR